MGAQCLHVMALMRAKSMQSRTSCLDAKSCNACRLTEGHNAWVPPRLSARGGAQRAGRRHPPTWRLQVQPTA